MRTATWRAIRIAVLVACAWSANPASAEPASGVTPMLLAQGTYDDFKVKSDNSFFEFEAEAKPAIDLVVRAHAYAPNSTTGWHTHDGPVFITVTQGTLVFYEYYDCTRTEVSAGQGYVDTGHGHVARNETGLPAADMTVLVVPVGATVLRRNLPAPNPNCNFGF